MNHVVAHWSRAQGMVDRKWHRKSENRSDQSEATYDNYVVRDGLWLGRRQTWNSFWTRRLSLRNVLILSLTSGTNRNTSILNCDRWTLKVYSYVSHLFAGMTRSILHDSSRCTASGRGQCRYWISISARALRVLITC